MSSGNRPHLFEDYTYGMSKDEVAARSNGAPCPDAPENRLLLCSQDTVKFLQMDWREVFWFNNLGELQQVVLERSQPALPDSLQSDLIASGWRPVFLETDEAAFDLLKACLRDGSENALQKLKDFSEKALANQNSLTIYFFPASFAEKTVGKIKTYSQAVDKAPEDFVMLSLAINSYFLKLFFTAPLLSRKNALRYGQIIRRK